MRWRNICLRFRSSFQSIFVSSAHSISCVFSASTRTFFSASACRCCRCRWWMQTKKNDGMSNENQKKERKKRIAFTQTVAWIRRLSTKWMRIYFCSLFFNMQIVLTRRSADDDDAANTIRTWHIKDIPIFFFCFLMSFAVRIRCNAELTRHEMPRWSVSRDFSFATVTIDDDCGRCRCGTADVDEMITICENCELCVLCWMHFASAFPFLGHAIRYQSG